MEIFSFLFFISWNVQMFEKKICFDLRGNFSLILRKWLTGRDAFKNPFIKPSNFSNYSYLQCKTRICFIHKFHHSYLFAASKITFRVSAADGLDIALYFITMLTTVNIIASGCNT